MLTWKFHFLGDMASWRPVCKQRINISFQIYCRTPIHINYLTQNEASNREMYQLDAPYTVNDDGHLAGLQIY